MYFASKIMSQTQHNSIGLDEAHSVALAEKLNWLLANYQVFYQNTRGYHWNIKGEKFFELHLKFEELYNNFQIKIDEIAERILTLGKTPLHTYSDYVRLSAIEEKPNRSNGSVIVPEILDGFSVLLKLQREILEYASNAGDEGTNALMSDYIREQEKLVWMYKSWLG